MAKAPGKRGAAAKLVLPGSKPPPPPGRVVPIGRHGRPREEIDAIQRDRILNAFVTMVGRVGLAKAYVNSVCLEARVSTKEFYDVFVNKDDCFVTAFDLGSQLVFDQAQLAYDRTEGLWEDRLAATLGTVLTILGANPAFARLCIVEAQDAGPVAEARLAATIQNYRQSFGGPEVPATKPMPIARPQLETVLTGSIFLPLADHVREGNATQLAELVPGLMYFVALATVGPERAKRQLELGAAKRGRR